MKIFVILICFFCVFSCQESFLGSDPPNTPRENFESLWRTLDEKYAFFEYKKVDWNEVYARYSPGITDTMSDVHLFNVLAEMLAELRDSHVNLESPFNISKYDNPLRSKRDNFDSKLINAIYLRKNFWTSGPLLHQLIADSSVGYIRYQSFADDMSSENVEFVIQRFKDTKGIIIDLRNNGGGNIKNVFTLATRFADSTRHVYTSYMKTGPGHNDFSAPNNVTISPSSVKYTKKVCILTNTASYSATSFFVLAMREFPHVTVVGDTTGGGLGAPTGAELPNGWSIRFSGSMTLTPAGENYEDGIPPDITIYLNISDVKKGHDAIIEEAIRIILSN